MRGEVLPPMRGKGKNAVQWLLGAGDEMPGENLRFFPSFLRLRNILLQVFLSVFEAVCWGMETLFQGVLAGGYCACCHIWRKRLCIYAAGNLSFPVAAPARRLLPQSNRTSTSLVPARERDRRCPREFFPNSANKEPGLSILSMLKTRTFLRRRRYMPRQVL